MSQTFIPLSDIQNYLDPRLWDICTAAILDGTSHANAIGSIIEGIQSWTSQASELTSAIEYHGLSGLTHSLTKHHALGLPLPASMIVKASTAKHAQRWDVICQTLELIHTASQSTDKKINFCLLKGSALATQIYTKPYERAMSDIDIMCSPEDAKSLYQACLEYGFHGPDIADFNLKNHHHLPAISIQVGQHSIHLEVHTHALSFDLNQQLYWADIQTRFRNIRIQDSHYQTLSHQDTLLLICVHAFARDQVIKLSNLVDMFRYALLFENEIDWPTFSKQHPNVMLMLRYSRMLLNLPDTLLSHIKPIPKKDITHITGLGVGMMPLREFNNKNMSLSVKIDALLMPSIWWQSAFYGTLPKSELTQVQRYCSKQSLWVVRYFIHPLKVASWVLCKAILPKLFRQ